MRILRIDAWMIPAIVAALLAGGAVHAQLKPSKGSEPLTSPGLSGAPATTAPAPAATPAPARQELSAKEATAVTTAAEWLKLIDAAQYGKSWDECAPLFREKVSRQTWIENLPKQRAAHGAFKSRSFSAAQARTSLPGAPDGEFVAVRFLSDFEKATAVEEVVTLMFVGGAWRPLGYLIR